jgi:hypothetical protein
VSWSFLLALNLLLISLFPVQFQRLSNRSGCRSLFTLYNFYAWGFALSLSLYEILVRGYGSANGWISCFVEPTPSYEVWSVPFFVYIVFAVFATSIVLQRLSVVHDDERTQKMVNHSLAFTGAFIASWVPYCILFFVNFSVNHRNGLLRTALHLVAIISTGSNGLINCLIWRRVVMPRRVKLSSVPASTSDVLKEDTTTSGWETISVGSNSATSRAELLHSLSSGWRPSSSADYHSLDEEEPFFSVQ